MKEFYFCMVTLRSHFLGVKVYVSINVKGKHEGKGPLGRPRSRWEDIKLDLQAVGWGGAMDWIDLAQGRDRWSALVNAVMNLRVP
jgi:hypothetical protein